jgi:type I restriction enzyme S subunit
MGNLTLQQIRELPKTVPDAEAQRRVLERLRSVDDLVKGMTETTRTAQTRSRRLRASILAAAFSGTLVPQDPDDEPASVLLSQLVINHEAFHPRKGRRKAAV